MSPNLAASAACTVPHASTVRASTSSAHLAEYASSSDTSYLPPTFPIRLPTSATPPSSLLFLFFFNDTATTEIYTLSLHDALPISLTVKLSKYNVDDVALGVCKTGAEEAGVTEVRTSLSEKKFELWREIKV